VAEFDAGYDAGCDARGAWEVAGIQPTFEGFATAEWFAGFLTGWEESRGRWGSPDRARS